MMVKLFKMRWAMAISAKGLAVCLCLSARAQAQEEHRVRVAVTYAQEMKLNLPRHAMVSSPMRELGMAPEVVVLFCHARLPLTEDLYTDSMKRLAAIMLWMTVGAMPMWAWGPLGHRLVADVAWDNLTPEAKVSVQALLAGESLADVSSWADHYLVGNYQTFYWHFINIPPEATSYDRNRDCLVQPRTEAGSRIDVWRDCVVERISYNAERVGDSSLDHADRAIALKFLVHLVGDEHQPFHTLGIGRGGNDIAVKVWGSDRCGTWGCNLHEVWDEKLIERRGLDETAWLKMLEAEIAEKHVVAGTGDAASWAMESHDLAKAALVTPGTNIDHAYYERNIGVVRQRLEQGGLRLAKLINAAFAKAPVAKV